MKTIRILAAATVLAASPAAVAHTATTGHVMVDPAAVQWGAGPPALPPGARAALLYGDPSKEGLFVMRLWVPAGFHIAPHMHSRPEILTIISGGFLLGMGTQADRATVRRLGPGSFTAMPAGMPHFAYTDEDTVLQISTTGPWAVNYINPADDPRNQPKLNPERG